MLFCSSLILIVPFTSFIFLKLLYHKSIIHPESTQWIVFLHGAGGSIQTWNHQVIALKQHYNLLLIDLRDHGKSKNVKPAYPRYNFEIVSQDVLNVLDAMGIESAHFITLSFGSVLMQSLYKRRPNMVDKMVLIGGIFNANLGIKIFVHLARFFNLFLSYKMMYEVFSFLLMPHKDQQLARRIYKMQARTLGADEYLKWLGLYSEFFKLLRSFNRQTIDHFILVLMGENDYLFLPSARKFATLKRNITFQLIKGAGHICNIDQPQKTNMAILSFLRNHKPQ